MKPPTIEEMAQNVAEKALDEYEYNGKTLRQWIEIILATASADTISRRAAIEAVGKLCDGCDNSRWCGECREVDKRWTSHKVRPVWNIYV